MERVDYESITINELISAERRGDLDIQPWYQRRTIWREPQKAYLINSVFEKKPIPSLYIRHHIDIESEKTVKEVVDGQQRITSIIQYRENKFSAWHPYYERKMRYDDLKKSDRKDFLFTALAIGYLVGADDRDVIEIFGRINSVSKNLNPQEKRNANFSGEYKQFCLKESAERLAFWRQSGVFTDSQIARMDEVQFVSELAINLIEGLTDYSATKINKYYQQNDEDFPMRRELSLRFSDIFDMLTSINPEKLRNTIFAKPQILFSLMVFIDHFKEQIDTHSFSRLVFSIDDSVKVLESKESLNQDERSVLNSFTSGNLHRIAKRSSRDQYLRSIWRSMSV